TTAARVVNNSYLATGSAVVDLTTYQPDSPASALVTGDEIVQLTFSSLTPDLSITSMTVQGGNGASPLQPMNTDIQVTAAIRNTGQVTVRNVRVSFFEDNVDRNGDGVMDFAPLDYMGAGVVAHSVGTNRAAGAILEVWEGAQRVAGPVTFHISPGADATLTVLWRPASTGTHVLMFSLRAATGTDIRNKDYVLGNNNATFSVNALTPPDLALHQSDYPGVRTVSQNQPFTIDVLVYNAGQTA